MLILIEEEELMVAVCLYGFNAQERAAVQGKLALSQVCVQKTVHTHADVVVVNANAVYGFLLTKLWPKKIILYGALSEQEDASFGKRFPYRVYYEDWDGLRTLLQFLKAMP